MNRGKCANRAAALACSVALIGFGLITGGCGANETNAEDLGAMKGLTMTEFAVATFQQNTLSRGADNGEYVDPGAPKE